MNRDNGFRSVGEFHNYRCPDCSSKNVEYRDDGDDYGACVRYFCRDCKNIWIDSYDYEDM
jgi:hypothetical protein